MTAASVVMTAWCMADGSGTGRTATGVVPLVGYTVAADWRVYAPGTVLLVLGLGVRVVEDRGGKVRGAHLDDYHGADAAACASAIAWGRQAREVLVLHRPAERTGSGKRETTEPGAETGKLRAHLSPLSVEASPSGATAGLENPASRSSMELRGRLTETPTENGRPGGRCPHASTEGSAGAVTGDLAYRAHKRGCQAVGIADHARVLNNPPTTSHTTPHPDRRFRPWRGEPGAIAGLGGASAAARSEQGSARARKVASPGWSAAPGFSEPLEARR